MIHDWVGIETFLHAPMYHVIGLHAEHLVFFHLHLPYLCEHTTNISVCKNVLFLISCIYICCLYMNTVFLPPSRSFPPSLSPRIRTRTSQVPSGQPSIVNTRLTQSEHLVNDTQIVGLDYQLPLFPHNRIKTHSSSWVIIISPQKSYIWVVVYLSRNKTTGMTGPHNQFLLFPHKCTKSHSPSWVIYSQKCHDFAIICDDSSQIDSQKGFKKGERSKKNCKKKISFKSFFYSAETKHFIFTVP